MQKHDAQLSKAAQEWLTSMLHILQNDLFDFDDQTTVVVKVLVDQQDDTSLDVQTELQVELVPPPYSDSKQWLAKRKGGHRNVLQFNHTGSKRKSFKCDFLPVEWMQEERDRMIPETVVDKVTQFATDSEEMPDWLRALGSRAEGHFTIMKYIANLEQAVQEARAMGFPGVEQWYQATGDAVSILVGCYVMTEDQSPMAGLADEVQTSHIRVAQLNHNHLSIDLVEAYHNTKLGVTYVETAKLN